MLSAPSVSLNNYFIRYNMIDKSVSKIIDSLVRPYYFGGRTEVFGNKDFGEKVLHYD